MSDKIYLNIIWNYKQPYVKDSFDNFLLPVVRQYMQRDYIDMIKIFENYPKLQATFNIVPSVLDQIFDYINTNSVDYALMVSQINAEELSQSDKEYILSNFFKGVDEVIIEPYKRYNDLYLKRIKLKEKDYLNTLTPYFSTQEYRDMQVWYHLAWIGKFSQNDNFIRGLLEKQENFTEEDKNNLFYFLNNYYSSGIDLYKKALDNTKIELSTSPYFYPNIPLSIDNHSGNLKNEKAHLPLQQFKGNEFIKKQLLHSRKYMKKIFKHTNLGIISPELSINNASLELLSKLRFDWTVIQDTHLFNDHEYYEKFFVHKYSSNDKHNINCFVNNDFLSKKILEEYPRMDTQAAINNFFHEIDLIRDRLEDIDMLQEPIITLFLPGDVIWDGFHRNGLEFLNELYTRLESHPYIETILPNEYLKKYQAPFIMNRINESNPLNFFDKWIGSPPANRAWEKLTEAYQFYLKKEKEGEFSEHTLKKVRRHLHIAMSSDWFEWYSNQESKWDIFYDELFRSHLIKCYELFFEKPVNSLFFNLKNESSYIFKSLAVSNNINPQIDGYETDFEEWEGAAVYDAQMHRINVGNHISEYIQLLYVGFNEKHLCLRITFSDMPPITSEFEIDIQRESEKTFILKPLLNLCTAFQYRDNKQIPIDTHTIFEINEIMEILIPIQELELTKDEYFSLQISLRKKEKYIERFPLTSYIRTKYELF